MLNAGVVVSSVSPRPAYELFVHGYRLIASE